MSDEAERDIGIEIEDVALGVEAIASDDASMPESMYEKVEWKPEELDGGIALILDLLLSFLSKRTGRADPSPEVLDTISPAVRRILLRHWPWLLRSPDILDGILIAGSLGAWWGAALTERTKGGTSDGGQTSHTGPSRPYLPPEARP